MTWKKTIFVDFSSTSSLSIPYLKNKSNAANAYREKRRVMESYRERRIDREVEREGERVGWLEKA